MAHDELRMLADGLERFKDDVGRYPTTEEGIISLRIKPYSSAPGTRSELIHWYGPYLDGDYELDPWGNDYQYHATNDAQGFELSSTGPNGEAEAATKFRVKSGEE
jgi:general secretion pathway protein G